MPTHEHAHAPKPAHAPNPVTPKEIAIHPDALPPVAPDLVLAWVEELIDSVPDVNGVTHKFAVNTLKPVPRPR